MKKIVNKLRSIRIFNKLFHTTMFCLEDSLLDCNSVLDIGCGPSSPIQNFKNIKYSVGVEIYKPYLEESKKRKIHNKYINSRIQDLMIKDKSFDAVIMIEVLEHMSKKDGLDLLNKAQRWAKKKIIISTPNGFFPMGKVDDNKYQEHVAGWTVKEFEKLGFRCHGITGAKFMYKKENHVHSLQEGFGFTNMRFYPQSFSFLINALLQIFIYYLPNYAFELFAIKKIK